MSDVDVGTREAEAKIVVRTNFSLDAEVQTGHKEGSLSADRPEKPSYSRLRSVMCSALHSKAAAIAIVLIPG